MELTLWTEKYRPKTFSEIKGQEEIVRKIKAFVEQKNMPHLLFAGPAGVGKTTLSLIIARQLFGDTWTQNLLELNASDERGIDIIRNKVKDFARTRAIGDVPFKIIYLDECLSYDANILIKSDNGTQQIQIGNFVENYDSSNPDYSVLSVNDNGAQEFVKVINAIKIPHKTKEGFYRIKAHDTEIKLTGNHRLLTPEGWKETRELKIGDMILCPLIENTAHIQSLAMDIGYNLIGLPREIKRKEKYITQSPEKSIIELLACAEAGLSRQEITKSSKIASSKLSSILSNKENSFYLALPHYNLIKNENNKYTLLEEKNKTLDKLYRLKRNQNKRNQQYIETQLQSLNLHPLKKNKAVIAARIMGHLLSDGCLSLKTKQLFFSGKQEDLETIKKDINSLGFHKLGNIRHNRWRNGECWSFGAYPITLLSLFYSLGAPVGRKTDTYFLIPDWIMNGDAEIKKSFLASFFGGEGSKPKFQGRTIKPIVVAQAKREDLKNNLVEYLSQMKLLLSEFGIESKIKILNGIKTVRKDKTKTIEGKLWVTNSRKNIMQFLDKVGYVYCKYKQDAAKTTLQYLSWKESLGKKVYTFRPVPHYAEWSNKYLLEGSAYFYVTEIEKIKDPSYVYCLTSENKKFIANGVIVHNCDALTREAQQALRRTMENYTATCRFILSCNYSSKIIDPIQSRCAVFRFKPLDKKDVYTIIDNIAKNEGIKITEKAKEALYIISEGDCRKAENILQSCAAIENNVTDEVVYSMASIAKPKEVKEVLELALEGKFIESRNKLLELMLQYSLSGQDVIRQIQKEIWNLNIDAKKRMQLIDKCAETEFRMNEGSDEFIQLEALLSQVALVGMK